MFQSIGYGELFVIGLVALIVFGPQRLPEMARKVGGYVRQLRSAAAEIKEGLDAEVRQLREPIDAVTKDLTKPITEIKQSLSETADALKKSAEPTTDAVNKTVDEVRSAGKVQWVGAEPKSGVSPGEAWDGMGDSVPDEVAAAPSEYVEEAGEPDDSQDES